jgi:hypothetical protein
VLDVSSDVSPAGSASRKSPLSDVSEDIVASGQPGGGGYVCSHCDLDLRCMEIDQAGTIFFSEAEWRTLAACHMRAHFSFKNLAAWYMCRICHDWAVDPPEVFVSPVAMMEHLENHENGDQR